MLQSSVDAAVQRDYGLECTVLPEGYRHGAAFGVCVCSQIAYFEAHFAGESFQLAPHLAAILVSDIEDAFVATHFLRHAAVRCLDHFYVHSEEVLVKEAFCLRAFQESRC